MKEINSIQFYGSLHDRKEHYPWDGQLELTYRCNLNCIHCYCKGSEDENRELTTSEWMRIIDELHNAGCVYITFTGGEPLIRDDFLELYCYAREKGFIITIFTNGVGLTDDILNYFVHSPPYKIEITLNGITKFTYESITQVEDSFEKVMRNIRKLKKKRLTLQLKSNLLKQNKNEIAQIKAFADTLLGKEKDKFHFRYDPMIYPRLDGDKTPCNYRLSFEELEEVKKQDPDIRRQYQKSLHKDAPDYERDRNFLYHCNSWLHQFFIDPYGRLKFCEYSNRFSTDLKKDSFQKGFYNVFPKLMDERFRTAAKCQKCTLRPLCYYCPARAYLEQGDEEAPIGYYCHLAQGLAKKKRLTKSKAEQENETKILQ